MLAIRLTTLPLISLSVLAACSDGRTPARGFAPTAPDSPRFLTTTAPSKTSILPTGKSGDVQDDTAPPPRTRYRIEYHNQNVFVGGANVYVIYYGTWNDSDPSVISDFISNVGFSSYIKPATLYTNSLGQSPTNVVFLGGSSTDSYSHGPTLTDADVADIVVQKLAAGALPADPAGIYVVMASPDVWESSGLDVSYCAFNGSMFYNGSPARYIFVGGPARSPQRCAPQAVGPNGTLGADAAVSLLAGQLFNVLTDPDLNAWYDKLGLEGADKCAWTFGTTYKAPNGALANVHLGVRDFLLQQVWVPTKNGGYCSLGI